MATVTKTVETNSAGPNQNKLVVRDGSRVRLCDLTENDEFEVIFLQTSDKNDLRRSALTPKKLDSEDSIQIIWLGLPIGAAINNQSIGEKLTIRTLRGTTFEERFLKILEITPGEFLNGQWQQVKE